MVILIQARLGSTRFPRKVCARLHGLTMVQQVYERANKIWPGTPIHVVVPHGESEIWPLGPVWEGPKEIGEDPLARFAAFARSHPQHTTLVRLTADCPLLDPGISRFILEQYFIPWKVSSMDGTVSWEIFLTGAVTSHELDGLDTEVFPASIIIALDQALTHIFDREHVTPYIRRLDSAWEYRFHRTPPLRWSVDTLEDLDFVREVYGQCDLCANAVSHHTNSGTSIGGSDRSLCVDLHVAENGGLVECTAADLLTTRIGGPVYRSV